MSCQPTSVCGHLLLRNENLLRAVDDEVAAGIQRTLVQLSEISVREAVQQTVRRSQHYRDLANERLLVLCFYWCLSLAEDGLRYVDVQWSRVSAYSHYHTAITQIHMRPPIGKNYINGTVLSSHSFNASTDTVHYIILHYM